MRIPFFSRGSTGPPSVISPPANDPAGEAAIDSAGDGGPAETNGVVVVQAADLAPDDPLALFDAEDPSEGPPPSVRAPRHDAGPHDARARVTVGATGPERRRAPKVRPDLPLQVSVLETDLAPANGHGTAAPDAHAAKALVPDRFRVPAPPALAPVPDPLLTSPPQDTVLEPLPQRSAADVATPARTPVPPAHPPTPAGPPLSLDTVLLRRTPIQWSEAVAIVDAACARLVRPDGTERPAPDLPGIFLHADGTVEVNDGVPGEASAVRLARTLHALAGAQAMPAPLRLLITKWIGSGGTHTLLEFAAELSYFARPDGQALVRALYERSAATPPPAPAPAAPAIEPPVLVNAREHERAAELETEPLYQPHRRLFRLSWVLPAILSIATAGAAGGMWLTTLIPGPGTGEPAAPSQESPAVLSAGVAVPDPAIDIADSAAGVVPAGVETDSQPAAPFEAAETGSRAAGGADPRDTTRPAAAAPPVRPAAPSSFAPTDGAVSSFPPPLVPSPPPVSTTAANGPGVPAPSDSISAPLVPPPASRPPSDGPPPTANGGGARPGPAAAALEENTPAPALDTLAPSAIYTPSDRDVQPPRLVYPQLPPPPTSGPDTAINTLEVVVDRNGRVEQVRLVSIPVRLTDMTLLSNAKNWRFEPALREGQPVRYRMRVSWATTP